MVPGNLGGMTWSGYAFDPQHSLLVINTNNLVAVAKLMSRAKYDEPGSHSDDGDYGDQTGAPYGLYRRFLQSPSDLPCSAAALGHADRTGHDGRKNSLANPVRLHAGFRRVRTRSRFQRARSV